MPDPHPAAAVHWERERDRLLAAASEASVDATLALAGVIARAPLRPAPYAIPIAGVPRAAFARLIASRFPALDAEAVNTLTLAIPEPNLSDTASDEFVDLAELLLENRSAADETSNWLAWAIATAAMAPDHLWQDMGLPSRAVLNRLLSEHFATLHRKNVGDMKWKKFFYRQLCEREQVAICRSPSCATCTDYAHCFGPEDAPLAGWMRIRVGRPA
jgi:nitrogen fixation protein NifQ